jgi:hypothetical protein
MDMAPANDQKESFEELIFKRELNEVYLLLDFISGRPDKHVWALGNDTPDPDDVRRSLTPFEVMQRICELSYPPTGTAELNAKNAAFLLYVRDRLNSLAYPARGLSIAYTYMFVGDDAPILIRRKSSDEKVLSRVSIAVQAYPSLQRSARGLRFIKSCMTAAALIITIFAALVLSIVTYGVQVTSRFEADRSNVTDITSSFYTALAQQTQPDPQLQRSGRQVCEYCSAKGVKGLNNDLLQICNDFSYIQARYQKAIEDATAFGDSAWFHALSHLLPVSPSSHEEAPTALANLDAQKRVAKTGHASEATAMAAQPTGDNVCSDNAPEEQGNATGTNDDPGGKRGKQENIQSITVVLSTYANYILPILFGLIGTIASMARSIQQKASQSLLAPRDKTLAIMRIPLGLVAGITVGMFFNPSTVVSQITSGAGVLTLSASGLAFLAGYGADRFFTMLDAVIRSLFVVDHDGRAIRH